MARSPAAVFYFFCRSTEDEGSRERTLRSRIGDAFCFSDSQEVADFDTMPNAKLPNRHIGLVHRRNNLPYVEGWVSIDREGGVHENVCFEDDRRQILDLLSDRVIDVVHFPVGLPTGSTGFFSKKYGPATVHGYRPFVALKLMIQGHYPSVSELRAPMESLLSESWEYLRTDDTVVTLQGSEQAAFLRHCSALSIFGRIAEWMARATSA